MDTPSNPKETAITFLQLAAAGKLDDAYDKFVAPGFRHHNPYFAGDAASLQAGMRENAIKHPDKVFEVQRAIAEGSLVAVHSRIQMPSSPLPNAVVHIFRFEEGKIVELWDVGQQQPEQMVNQFGMF